MSYPRSTFRVNMRLRQTSLVAMVLLAGMSPCTGSKLRGQASAETRAVNIGLNGAIGGVLATARAAIARKPLRPAAVRGFEGGALIGAGKQIAGGRFFGSGLLGRHVSLLGVAVTYSATTDTFTYFIPVGPVTVEWKPAARSAWHARMSVAEAIGLVRYATSANTRLDIESTLSSGTPVFVRRGPIDADDNQGFEDLRLIIIASTASRALTRAHETIHVIQDDEVLYLFASPLERDLVSRLFGSRSVLNSFEPGVSTMLFSNVWNGLRYCENPYEVEAFSLTERSWRTTYC